MSAAIVALLSVLAQIASPDLEGWVRRMRVLDLAGWLDADDYYILDDHLRPSGHQKLAKAVADEIALDAGPAGPPMGRRQPPVLGCRNHDNSG